MIETIINLLQALNVTNISDLPEPWQLKLDDSWYIAINGQKTAVEVEPEHLMMASIPPYHFCVWYNGWLAGLFNPFGDGVFAAGSGANEDTFISAIEAYIARE